MFYNKGVDITNIVIGLFIGSICFIKSQQPLSGEKVDEELDMRSSILSPKHASGMVLIGRPLSDELP